LLDAAVPLVVPQTIACRQRPFGPARGDRHAEDATLPLARTQGGALLRIDVDLAQHRGQMEITRNLSRTPRAQFG
jgi:hypothetical protein